MRAIWLAAFATLPVTGLGAAMLDNPEQEIQRVDDSLNEISRKINAETVMRVMPGHGSGSASSIQAMESAKKWYTKGNWLAALRELKRYESGTNTHNTENFLNFNYISGKAEAALGNYDRALTFYKRFLAEASKNPTTDPERINDVLASVLEGLLKSKKSPSNLNLRQNIAAILVTEENTDANFEAHFLAGRLAVIDNSPELASEWLDKATKSPSKSTTTRGMFYQALVELASNHTDAAYDILRKAEENSNGEDTVSYHHQILLALGRIEYFRKHYAEALGWLLKIPESSLQYQSSLRESIHAATSAEKYAQGLELANRFLLRFPESEFTHEVSQYSSYLTLQSTSEKVGEEVYEKRLKQLSNWAKEIKEQTLGKDKIDEGHLNDIIGKVRAFGNPGLLATHSANVFAKLNKLQEKVHFLQSSVLEQVYWHSSQSFPAVFPDETIQANELNGTCNSLINQANRLVAISTYVMENALSKAALESLNRSAKRRDLIVDEEAKFQRGFDSIGDWVNARYLIDKLSKMQIYNLNQLAIERSFPKSAESAEYINHSEAIQKKIVALSNKVHLKAADALSTISPFLSTEKLLLQFSLEMSYDYEKFSALLTADGDYATRELMKNLKSLWNRWFQTAEILSVKIRQSQSNLEKTVEGHLNGVKEISEKLAFEAARITQLRSELEKAVGKTGHLLSNQFILEINARSAEIREWMAELNMKKLENLQNKHREDRIKAQVEHQKIAEDYLDSTLRRSSN
jgi:hypothetical protein